MSPKSPENHYTDALYFFSIGLLDRSLSEFLSAIEEGVTKPDAYNNAASILLYKGRFSEAFKLYKLNWQKNKDDDAAKFLNEVHDLNAFIKNYNTAIDYISDSNYKEALKVLNREAAQGYRIQNGEILRCILYYMQENYNKSRQILNDIHEVDRECEFYLYMSKVLDNKKRLFGWKRILAGALIGLLLISNGYFAFELNKKNKELNQIKTAQGVTAKVPLSVTPTPTSSAEKAETPTPTAESTPTPTLAVDKITPTPEKTADTSANQTSADTEKVLSNLEKYLSSGDLYSFEKEKALLNVSNLDNEQKKAYDKLNSSFTANAQSYFYKNGLSLYKQKSYSKSLEYFKIAYNYKNGSYLDQHVLYFTAMLTKKNSLDPEKYFLEYYNTYKNGCYMDEVLYYLSVLYNKKGNITEAKKYALQIQKSYSNSDFYNDTIKSIISK